MEHINRTMNEYIEELKQKDKKILSTGFEYIDNSIKGLNAGELIVIASRPQIGKTTLLINIAKNVVMNEQVSVAIFSLEMSKQRCIECLNILDSSIIRDIDIESKTNIDDLNDIEKLAEAKLFIDDTPAISLQELEEKCTKLKKNEGLEVIFIDYLQLVKNNNENICNELKCIAKRLDVTIIATAQLTRRIEEREDKRPYIADFSCEGIKPFYSDVIILLYRDDYYNINSPYKNITELIIAKNSNGETGTVKLLLKKECLKFENIY